MIVSKIIGGIGNQMFQYAAGYAHSMKYSENLILDVRDFKGYNLHNGFELDEVFGIEGQIRDEITTPKILRYYSNRYYKSLARRFPNVHLLNPSLIIEPHHNYWSGWEGMPKNIYLEGYWQSEKYFGNYRREIRDKFTFIKNLNNRSDSLNKIISNDSFAVSIHIRRGDYITDNASAKILGGCDIDYYKRAIDFMKTRKSEATFYVFSDEIDWIKGQGILDEYKHIYVEHNKGGDSWQDLFLMSQCKHNITANSTFSWWGAWLNRNIEKIVVAPKKWFVTENINGDDIVPADWIKL